MCCVSHRVCTLALGSSTKGTKERVGPMARPLLQYPPNVPPAAVIVAARLGGFDVDAKAEKDWPSTAAPVVTFADGAKLSGVVSMLRYFARSSSHSLGLYGNDAFTSTLVCFRPWTTLAFPAPHTR